MEIRDLESFETEQEMLDYLIETGSIYWHDLDENNDPIYLNNIEACELYAPWYLKEVYRELDDVIVQLMDAGLVQPSGMDGHGEMVFELTPEAQAALEEQQ